MLSSQSIAYEKLEAYIGVMILYCPITRVALSDSRHWSVD